MLPRKHTSSRHIAAANAALQFLCNTDLRIWWLSWHQTPANLRAHAPLQPASIQHCSSCRRQVMSAGQLTLAAAQKQEERLLQAALKQRREEVGPPPELIAAAPPETPPRAFSFRLPPKPQAAQDQQSSPATVQSGTSASPEAATSAVNQQSSAQSISPSGSQRGKQRQQRASPESSPKQAPTAPAGFVPFTSDNY